MGRKKGMLILYPVIVILLAIIVVLVISALVGWGLTHPKREKVNISPDHAGLKYENVHFKSRGNSISLKGWLLPSPGSNKTVIFAHGYAKNRLQTDVPALPIAQSLIENGYNVLMFDFRNSGKSEGNITSIGQFETQDLLGAVDYIKSRPDINKDIVLFGFSMGAATSILAGAREPSVSAVIADAPFADLNNYLMQNLSVWSKLPAFPFNQSFLIIVPLITGLKPSTVSPVKEIKNFNGRPLLLIHGEKDTAIPILHSEMLQKAYPKAQLFKVPGAGHIKSYATAKEIYIQKIFDFLNKI
ncbi:MAG: alpha/beta hydrolase [Bacillota bacterium]